MDFYEKQLQDLEKELAKVPDDMPTKPLWKAMLYILTYWGNVFDRIKIIEDQVKVIQSDSRETKNMVSKLYGNGGIKFDENNHPNRRKTDEEDKTPERTWFIEKVLPGLVQTLIISIVAIFATLIVLNIQGFIK